MFFKKKNKGIMNNDLVSPVDGVIIPIEQVKDSVFAEQLMGQTMCIQPKDEQLTLVSPANGYLEVLFPTGHAYAVTLHNGLGILVHIGIDTVGLHGKGFTILAKQGEEVQAGDPIVRVDFKALRKAGYETSVMIIVTNNPNHQKLFFKTPQEIKASKDIMRYERY